MPILSGAPKSGEPRRDNARGRRTLHWAVITLAAQVACGGLASTDPRDAGYDATTMGAAGSRGGGVGGNQGSTGAASGGGTGRSGAAGAGGTGGSSPPDSSATGGIAGAGDAGGATGSPGDGGQCDAYYCPHYNSGVPCCLQGSYSYPASPCGTDFGEGKGCEATCGGYDQFGICGPDEACCPEYYSHVCKPKDCAD